MIAKISNFYGYEFLSSIYMIWNDIFVAREKKKKLSQCRLFYDYNLFLRLLRIFFLPFNNNKIITYDNI